MIALLVQLVFSLIMLVDAWHRRLGWLWYLVILLPLGELYYFTRLFLKDPAFRCYRRGDFRLAKNLARAKRSFALNPSLDHRRLLAHAHLANSQPEEALELLEPFQHQHSEDLSFQVLLGKALLRTGRFQSAAQVLEPIVEKQPKALEFEAWLLVIAAYAGLGQKERVLEEMERLQLQHPRMRHQLSQAAYLAHYGERDRAREMLLNALETFRDFPKFLHWEHGFWAAEAKRMLRQKLPKPF